MVSLQLYTTLGCHLCEQAEVLLQAQGENVQWRAVEIADSEELLQAYGLKIPVVRCESTGEELNWPFDGQELDSWLQKQRR